MQRDLIDLKFFGAPMSKDICEAALVLLRLGVAH